MTDITVIRTKVLKWAKFSTSLDQAVVLLDNKVFCFFFTPRLWEHQQLVIGMTENAIYINLRDSGLAELIKPGGCATLWQPEQNGHTKRWRHNHTHTKKKERKIKWRFLGICRDFGKSVGKRVGGRVLRRSSERGEGKKCSFPFRPDTTTVWTTHKVVGVRCSNNEKPFTARPKTTTLTTLAENRSVFSGAASHHVLALSGDTLQN